MSGSFDTDNLNEIPYIMICGNEAIDVSDSFLQLSGYCSMEIINKNIEQVFKNLLKANIDVDSINNTPKSLFIFTKSIDPREVEIAKATKNNKELITFIEKPHSRIEEKFSYIEYLHKSGVAIYSADDLTLLRANKTFFEFIKEPYNNKEGCIGKSVGDFLKDFTGSPMEQIWKDMMNSGEALYIKEFAHFNSERGNTYWDFSAVPMKEDGKVKYIIINSINMTDRVLNRIHIEEQNKLLKHKEEQLRLITENMNDALFIVNKDGTYEYYNDHAVKIANQIGIIDAHGNLVLDYIYYDQTGIEITKDGIPSSKILSGEEIQNVVVRVERPEYTFYFNFNGSPIYNADGQIISAIFCFRDITEKYKHEQEIKEKKDQLETVFETIPDSLIVSDKDGNIIATNPVADYIAKKFLFMPIEKGNLEYNFGVIQYLDMDHNPIPLDEMPHKRVSKGEKISNFKYITKISDLEIYIDSYATPIFDKNGNFVMSILCCRNITDLVNKELEIIKQKELVEATIENMNDAIVIFDKAGSVILANAEARKRYPHINTNTKIENVHTGLNCFDMDNNPIPVENLPTRRVIRGERISNERLTIKYPDRNVIIEVNAVPVFDGENNLISAVVSHHDITQIIEYEDTLKSQNSKLLKAEREKNEILRNVIEMKDEFLTTITHEFKTPLSVIHAAVQAINELYSKEMSDNIKKHIQRIRLNSLRQIRLVNNLLDITKYNAGHIKIYNKNIDIVFLTEAITQSVKVFANQKEINLQFSSDIEFKEIAIDDEKYERILLNLLSNAIKFTPKGKSIYVFVTCKDNKVFVIVKDEGVGIPENKRDIIFERFGQVDSSLTRQAEGTGIGLSLVKSLISAMGGNVSVESEINQGSTFTLSLHAKTINKTESIPVIQNQTNNRITQSVAIEFSDIYID
ncbi:sensor histidine kinase [Pseudobacteroides cellulosolvens]|uniref:histidine kinase n=1 Tax=Pseudobacteroides cellulosolvens ATCC 35603 = DSM 2933 TaxID=398512 RepID=A0A0L6JJM4_9FIRM|nr:PAS domain-containing sensor histidine kinase [Pseudobacteroides cellulosolvens]KNY25940.1 PAS/PAC sensor signal transduction histidine kinase [Pseudobacteroides cellulosolvens ATCC 35603 = DSM 2933]